MLFFKIHCLDLAKFFVAFHILLLKACYECLPSPFAHARTHPCPATGAQHSVQRMRYTAVTFLFAGSTSSEVSKFTSTHTFIDLSVSWQILCLELQPLLPAPWVFYSVTGPAQCSLQITCSTGTQVHGFSPNNNTDLTLIWYCCCDPSSLPDSKYTLMSACEYIYPTAHQFVEGTNIVCTISLLVLFSLIVVVSLYSPIKLVLIHRALLSHSPPSHSTRAEKVVCVAIWGSPVRWVWTMTVQFWHPVWDIKGWDNNKKKNSQSI